MAPFLFNMFLLLQLCLRKQPQHRFLMFIETVPVRYSFLSYPPALLISF
jgi:hypothetical protein